MKSSHSSLFAILFKLFETLLQWLLVTRTLDMRHSLKSIDSWVKHPHDGRLIYNKTLSDPEFKAMACLGFIESWLLQIDLACC
jgi:hypothetical protein